MSGKETLASRIAPLFVIIAAGLLLGHRLISGGYLYTWDADMHMLWAHQFLKGFRSGVAYPRWLADANAGYGSPAFVFYPPFIFYTYVAISVFLKEIPAIVNVSAVLALMASGLSMYALGRLFFGRPVALITSLIYMALPYHLLDIYLRSAMAEFWAFAWMPLVLYFAFKFPGKGTVVPFAGLSVSYAGLIVTHLPVVLLFTPFVLAFIVFLRVRERDRRALLMRALALSSGIALSAFYLVPAVFEQKYVNIDVLTKGPLLTFYNNYIFSSSTQFGHIFYAGAAIAAALLMVLYAFASLMAEKTSDDRDRTVLFFTLMGMAAVFMTTPVSRPVWEALTALHFHKIQFPVRFMAAASLFAALSAGGTLKLIPESMKNAKIPLTAAVLIILASNMMLSKKAIADYRGFDRQGFSLRTDMSYVELTREFGRFRSRYRGLLSNALEDTFEYRPVRSAPGGVSKIVEPPPDGVRAIFHEGAGKSDILRWEPEDRLLRIRTDSGGKLLLRTFYYEGWRAYLDGKAFELGFEPSSGLMTAALPPGAHELGLRYEGTPWQTTGEAVSLLTLLLLSGYSLRVRHKRHTHICAQ